MHTRNEYRTRFGASYKVGRWFKRCLNTHFTPAVHEKPSWDTCWVTLCIIVNTKGSTLQISKKISNTLDQGFKSHGMELSQIFMERDAPASYPILTLRTGDVPRHLNWDARKLAGHPILIDGMVTYPDVPQDFLPKPESLLSIGFLFITLICQTLICTFSID